MYKNHLPDFDLQYQPQDILIWVSLVECYLNLVMKVECIALRRKVHKRLGRRICGKKKKLSKKTLSVSSAKYLFHIFVSYFILQQWTVMRNVASCVVLLPS